jgi:hypothetical protein
VSDQEEKVSTADDLLAWGQRREPVEAFSTRYLGARVPLGRNFPCPLPDHTRHASFYRDPQAGIWKLRCWCAEDAFLTIAEVRASIAYGYPKALTGPRKSDRRSSDPEATSGNIEAAVWYLRAWHDAGLIAPLELRLPAAPNNNNAVVASVRDGFSLLVGLRWLCYPDQPVAYTRTFASAWCDGSITPMQAYHAISALADNGVIREADSGYRAGPWTGKLWLPGAAR